MWFPLKNKVLTSEKLQKKGIKGPSLCSLCGSIVENIANVLIMCPFAKQVWKEAESITRIQTIWTGMSMEKCLIK
jgi:hypothetical protein